MGSERCAEPEAGRKSIVFSGREEKEMRERRCTVIVLAGGQGKRMGTKTSKQYLDILGKPVLYYSLYAFEQSEIIDDIILVVGSGQVEYVKNEFLNKWDFQKIRKVVEGGRERYHSVWEGLKAIREENRTEGNYVYIHDSARPFITEEIIKRAQHDVEKYGACVVGMPSKDTIKIADEEGFASETPPRDRMWIVQTPQVFEASIIIEAYSRMMEKEQITATDDAIAVEQELHLPVRMTEGSYENIKITTPEDLEIAEVFARRCFDAEKQ